MSKGSKRKRATRPWQDPDAFRDLGRLYGAADVADDLELAGYEVRRVPAERASKDYICPSCGNTVGEGEGHVVVWPVEDSDLRRHWHTHCWRIEIRTTADVASDYGDERF